MPLFACDQCHTVENTALCFYNVRAEGDPALCSRCDPRIGKWHDAFPMLTVTQDQIDRGVIINRKGRQDGRTDHG